MVARKYTLSDSFCVSLFVELNNLNNQSFSFLKAVLRPCDQLRLQTHNATSLLFSIPNYNCKFCFNLFTGI